MKKTILAAAMAAAMASSGGAMAAAAFDPAAFAEELAAIKARMKALESQVQDQSRTIQAQERALKEKDRQIQEFVSNPRIRKGEAGGGWFQNVEIGGVVEIEAGYNDPDEGDSESDVVVATAEIGIAAQINDWTSSEITLLYEEDDTDLEVDVAIISIANPDGPWFTTAGQQYVPFGTYETNLVSDPFTLELGETRETALLAGVELNGFVGGVYGFNGDIDEDGDSKIDSFGAFAGYGHENENSSFAVNVGYINNIADSDGLQDTINDNIDDPDGDPMTDDAVDFDDQVAGVTIDGMFTTGPFTFIAEYTTATDDFTSVELPYKSGGAEPSAFNVEAAYSFMIAGKDATLAVAYQETDEAVALELPEERISAAISVGVMDNTTLSLEWAHDNDYSKSDRDAVGLDEKVGGDTITGQLAVEF